MHPGYLLRTKFESSPRQIEYHVKDEMKGGAGMNFTCTTKMKFTGSTSFMNTKAAMHNVCTAERDYHTLQLLGASAEGWFHNPCFGELSDLVRGRDLACSAYI